MASVRRALLSIALRRPRVGASATQDWSRAARTRENISDCVTGVTSSDSEDDPPFSPCRAGLLSNVDQGSPRGVSPTSTGSAGSHFEAQVGRLLPPALLTGGEPRGLPGTSIDRVELQRAAEGRPLDDVIVHAHDVGGANGRLDARHDELAGGSAARKGVDPCGPARQLPAARPLHQVVRSRRRLPRGEEGHCEHAAGDRVRPRTSRGRQARVRRRPTFSNHSDHVVESITGHLSRRMLEHYSHIRLKAKKDALDRLDESAKATPLTRKGKPRLV